MRFTTPEEIDQWDELVLTSPNGGDIFQTKAFAQTKSLQGLKTQYVIYDIRGRIIPCLYLTRTVPGFGQVWYAPKGPGIIHPQDFDLVVQANRTFAAGKNIFLFKMEPELPLNVDLPSGLYSVHNIQPNASTAIVSLSLDEEAILASFRQRARRAIRQAQAAGVTVQPAEPTQETYHQLHTLYLTTAARAGFHVRDFSYYQTSWSAWAKASQGQAFFAHHQGRVVAGAFVTYLGHKGLYKDGASDRDAMHTGAAHLLQWEIMRWLKAHGVTHYDMHGTPPSDQLENKAHKYYGLGLFKTSFQNQLTEYIGTLDQPIKPAAYKLWRKFGERGAQSLEYRLKGRTFY